MKHIMQQCSAYTAWANKKLFDCIATLPEETINQEINSSFPSLRLTVLHMWNAESIWWQRLKLQERVEPPAPTFTGDFAMLQRISAAQSLQWAEWVKKATEVQLQHVFAFRRNKKEEIKKPVYEVLLQLYSHGSYHRGQLVTMLRQVGVVKIPQTDFSIFPG